MLCIVLPMESSASHSPIDLLELFKSPEVSRISTFGEVAGRLDPGNLVAAYVSLRNSAPRRHDREKSYFVDHAWFRSSPQRAIHAIETRDSN